MTPEYSLDHEDSDLRHEANLAFLRAGKGGLTLGATYYGTEAQYRQAHGLDIPEEAETSDAEPDGSEKDQNNHETTLVLNPGSAVFVSDPSAGGSRWIADGDFKLFLEPGEAGSSSDGLVRELLVGGFRQPEGGDFEHTQGTFLDDPGWESVVGSLQTRVFELERQIGFVSGTEQAADQLPRGESWLAERADSDAKLADANAKLSALESELAAAIKSPSGLPANAREVLTNVKGVGEALADAIIAAFASGAIA